MENPAKRVARDELDSVYKMLFPLVRDAKGEIVIDHVTGEPIRSEKIAPHLKGTFISILMRLDFVSVYVFYMTRELVGFFFENDIWQTLARAWLGKQRFEDAVSALEPLVPPKKRMNFLWLILAHYVAVNDNKKVKKHGNQRFSIYNIRIEPMRIKYISITQLMSVDNDTYDVDADVNALIHVVRFERSDWMDDDVWLIVEHFALTHFGIRAMRLVTREILYLHYNHIALMKTMYAIMITFKGAVVRVESTHIKDKDDDAVYIRSKIPTPHIY